MKVDLKPDRALPVRSKAAENQLNESPSSSLSSSSAVLKTVVAADEDHKFSTLFTYCSTSSPIPAMTVDQNQFLMNTMDKCIKENPLFEDDIDDDLSSSENCVRLPDIIDYNLDSAVLYKLRHRKGQDVIEHDGSSLIHESIAESLATELIQKASSPISASLPRVHDHALPYSNIPYASSTLPKDHNTGDKVMHLLPVRSTSYSSGLFAARRMTKDRFGFTTGSESSKLALTNIYDFYEDTISEGENKFDRLKWYNHLPKPTTELMRAIQLGMGQSVGGLASKPERDLLLQDFTIVDSVFYPRPTSELMAAIQLGIGQSITSLSTKPKRDLLLQDFSIVDQVFFPREGSNLTPAHHCSDFRFKTYAPIAFRYFRELFRIQPDDFLLSLCNEPLQELSNPGASGSIFYITNDDEFIIKTVQHKEAEFLQKLLPGYYMNLNQNPRTLLPKFYGLFCYQCGGKNIRFVVMNNLLPSSITMHEKYDMKGSTYKRKASKHERAKKSPTLKDLDFLENHLESLQLEADTFNALMKTVERDCRVLQSFKIMDYSMLLGVHNLDAAESARNKYEGSDREVGQQDDHLGSSFARGRSVKHRLAQYSTAMEAIQAPSEPLELDNDNIPPGGIPARSTHGERLLLYIGIIDILQSYRLKKKLEHAMKAMVHDGDTISVHRPGFYSQRFQSFFSTQVFRKIPSLDTPTVKGPHMRFKKLVQLVRVCTDPSLKHSPSKKKTPGRQRSVSDYEGKIPSKETGDRQRTTSEADAGAVGGRPDLLPANATPPGHYLEESRSGKEIKSWSSTSHTTQAISERTVISEINAREADVKRDSLQTHDDPLVHVTPVPLGSPVPSFTESTPTHTEYTEGTPSFTASSPSGSSDLLDSTPGFSQRSTSRLGNASDLGLSEEHIELEIMPPSPHLPRSAVISTASDGGTMRSGAEGVVTTSSTEVTITSSHTSEETEDEHREMTHL